MKYILLLLTALYISPAMFSQNHWESIIIAGNQWQYLPAKSEPPAGWYQPGFDDNSWQTGHGGFGYADGDDATIIDTVNSVYLRTKFDVQDISLILQLLLDVDYDDAFVAYLNGQEVALSFNVTDVPPVYNSTLSTDHEAQIYQGNSPERHILDPSMLVEGENTLAVQVINMNLTSSDMSSLVFLSGEINSSSTIFQPIPDWFIASVNINESNLPIIEINTSGQTIPDNAKITAYMGIINNEGGINHVDDPFNEYDGYIGIELRGSSSQMFDKKNYTVETCTELDSNLNVPLLGMPEENDWVLHGPYSDKSLIRNALAYYLGSLTGRWAPRTRLCELYINDDYRGVYVLMEKIKRDKNRVDIAKLNPDEITGDDLTGGYLLKIDRPDYGAWTSPFKGVNGINDILVSYVEPIYQDMPSQQQNYIKEYVTEFEYTLDGPDFKDPVNGYRPYIDVQSFVDYFLVNELSKNIDAYRLSTFFSKDKDSKGGKITMGPLWDYDLAFGNANYYEGGYTEGWVIHSISSTDGFQVPFWWEKLREDAYFDTQLKFRWQELRSGQFSEENIFNYIDSTTTLLVYAQQRNFEKFPILSTYIWPNFYIGGSYANEITYLKGWISDRIAWMDSQIASINAVDEPVSPFASAIEVYAYPNPFTESFTLRLNLFQSVEVNIAIRNILGEIIGNKSMNGIRGGNDCLFSENLFGNNPGIYFYEVSIEGKIVYAGKLIKI
jgi:hypothetical protein